MSKKRLTQLARSLSCTVDWARWEIDAPPNKAFADGGPHSLVFEPYDWDNFTWEDQYQDAIRRLECGLIDCHCGDCDQEGK
jgi:hypothetical protein